MPKPLHKKLQISLVTALLFLGTAELGLRLFGYRFQRHDIPLIVWNTDEDKQLDTLNSLHQSDPACLWIPRHHAAVPWSPGESVNARGYRGPLLEPSSDSSTFRVAFLGDSSTFGWGVSHEQTFAATCAAQLSAAGIPSESLNAGVVGYTITQGLARYRDLIRPHHPDAVVIGFGAVNDHLYGPGQESDSDKITQLEASDNAIGSAFRWCRTNLRTAHLISHLRFRRNGGRKALRQRLRATRNTTLTNLHLVGQRDYPGVRRVSLPEYRRNLEELIQAIRSDGARPILLSMPRKQSPESEFPILVDYSHATEAAATRLSIPLIDIRTHFRTYGEIYETSLFFDYWHPRPKAHTLIATDLQPLLLSIATERGHAR